MPVNYHHGGFPPKNLDWDRLLPLVGPANRAIAGYDGVVNNVPNPDILLSPLATQEAVLSTRIEGTQASLSEVLEFEAQADENATNEPKRDDYQEVLNYRYALRYASERLETLPLSQRLIREAHGLLMQGVRGQDRDPGAFRRIQNYIGPQGEPIEKARYVPPAAQHVQDRMNELELFMVDEHPDTLVQLALVHAEIEAIHPFLDGNGRIGRLIIPLFLKDKGILRTPNFYLSGYLERNGDEYRNRLLAVSRDEDWTGWCAFFLRAIIDQAQENRAKAEQILALYDHRKDWITDVTRSPYGVRILDRFFERPIFTSSQLTRDSDITSRTVQRILNAVREQGVLLELRPGRGNRPALYAYTELLNIANA